MRPGKFVVDVDYAQFYKQGQRIGGDVFLYSRNPEKNRIVCTLSDGLGSGVKANVLASMTLIWHRNSRSVPSTPYILLRSS